MKSMKLIIVIGLVILGLVGLILTNKNSDNSISFELKDLDGKVHKLSDYNGKKVYIKFWASWCSICLAGLEDIDNLSASDKDFEVITIVSPEFKGEKNSEEFKKWFGSLNYKNSVVLLDEKGVLAQKQEIRANPTSLFIDSKGDLVKTIVGYKTNDEIKAVMKEIK